MVPLQRIQIRSRRDIRREQLGFLDRVQRSTIRKAIRDAELLTGESGNYKWLADTVIEQSRKYGVSLGVIVKVVTEDFYR